MADNDLIKMKEYHRNDSETPHYDKSTGKTITGSHIHDHKGNTIEADATNSPFGEDNNSSKGNDNK